MPLLPSNFKTGTFFKNPHFNTIYKTFFYYHKVAFTRKRIPTPDSDFLDIDFSFTNSKSIVIVIHGLEGSSNSPYIRSATSYLNKHQIDVAALNLRGCSGTPNHLLSSYHSGKTDDLKTLLSYLETNYKYESIVLLGYSLGGNLILKYLGEENTNIPSKLICGIAVSVPCDLKGSSFELNKIRNYMYLKKFMISLESKATQKLKAFPNSFLSKDAIASLQNFKDFDDLYTAPAHGFKDANDYWKKNSSKQFLTNITTPTLLISALDDSFLSPSCYPFEEAKHNANFYLETPKYGGHVGFNSTFNNSKNNWIENRVLEFILQNTHH